MSSSWTYRTIVWSSFLTTGLCCIIWSNWKWPATTFVSCPRTSTNCAVWPAWTCQTTCLISCRTNWPNCRHWNTLTLPTTPSCSGRPISSNFRLKFRSAYAHCSLFFNWHIINVHPLKSTVISPFYPSSTGLAIRRVSFTCVAWSHIAGNILWNRFPKSYTFSVHAFNDLVLVRFLFWIFVQRVVHLQQIESLQQIYSKLYKSTETRMS